MDSTVRFLGYPRSLQILAIALLGGSLASCMVGPDFHTPPAPVTPGYDAKPLPLHTVKAPGNSNGSQAQHFVIGQDIPPEWWALFHSPALNALIQLGLANSPNLLAAQAALEQADEALNAQIGSLWPSANLLLNQERVKSTAASLAGTNAGGPAVGSGQATANSVASGSSVGLFNLYNASVNVSYVLDVFGGTRRAIESSAAQVDYQNYQLEAAYLTLTSNIVTTAITIASLQDQIEATQALIQAEEEQLIIINKQFHLGGVAGANVLTQETLVAQTRATLPPLEQNLAKSQHALAVLVGAFPSNIKIPSFNLATLCLPKHLPVSLPSALVGQRPDVQASEALLHSASAQIGVATANMLPQISLTGSYGFSGPSPGGLFSMANNFWSFGSQLLQPLFQGGALIAKRRGAIDAYKQAAAQYQETVLQAFQNVADTLRALQNDALTLQAQQQAEFAAHDSLAITQKQFKLGGVSYLSLLTAQQQYQQARINRIRAEAARFTDTAALFQALGGGWWNRTTPLPAINGDLTHAS